MTSSAPSELPAVTVRRYRLADFPAISPRWNAFAAARGYAGYYHRTEWGRILQWSMGQEPYFLCAERGDAITGLLPLAFVRSPLFGRFLVSLPYLNSAGVLSDCPESAKLLIDDAVRLANELQVRHLELRHETEIAHPQLTDKMTTKFHLRLPLPPTADELMKGFKAKLRSQVKKSLANGQTMTWGGTDLLNEFYRVFSRNMRDLGTPVFPRSLFGQMLELLPNDAELGVLRHSEQPVAAALLLHGPGTTHVPSASTLREFNATNANMHLYWQLLARSIERGQSTFDFGRSSLDSGTYKFKAQWGAQPDPAVWQYFRRKGQTNDLRPDNSKFQRLIQIWQKLPVPLANWMGPWIVRGIP